jgi:hypothetical protein
MSELRDERSDLFLGMTRHPRPKKTPYGEQDENGVDWSILRANLRLTPLERLRRADAAARSLLRLRANVRRIG